MRSLLVLAVTALVLCGQLACADGIQIRHTTPAGTVTLSTRRYEWLLSGPVGRLKDALSRCYSVPHEMLHVVWHGTELRDDADISRCRSAPKELHILMDFYLIEVTKPDKSNLFLAGEQGDTIASLKVKIARKEKIACYQQSLMRDNEVLGDQRRLDEFVAQNGGVLSLNLVVKDPGPVSVRVKLPSGELIVFELEPQEHVASLKDKIQAEKGVASERQSLYLNRRVLTDDEILATCADTSGDPLTLILVDREAPVDDLQVIYVRLGSNRLVAFEITPTDLVASLKKKISEAEGIAQERQHLYVALEEIADNMQLGGCVPALDRKPIVDLVVCSRSMSSNGTSERGGGMHVHVKTHRNREEIFEIAPGETLASLKARIRHEKNMPQDQQLHLFNGRQEMTDDAQIVEQILHYGSQLNLFAPSDDEPQVIHVKLPSGRLVTYEIAPSNSVQTLKNYIEHDRGCPNEKQQLFFGSQRLGDSKRLDEYNIVSGSTLILLVLQEA